MLEPHPTGIGWQVNVQPGSEFEVVFVGFNGKGLTLKQAEETMDWLDQGREAWGKKAT